MATPTDRKPGEERMPRYVAFLKGINVGNRRVKMDHLRGLFEGHGLVNVSTYIASGNVIFETADTDAPALEARIEGELRQALGYAVDTFARTTAGLALVAAFRPFGDGEPREGHSLHVGFLRQAPADEARRAVEALRTERDAFRFEERELYWLCRGKVTDSLVGWPVLAKTLGVSSTMRNLTTVRQLAGLTGADSARPPGK